MLSRLLSPLAGLAALAISLLIAGCGGGGGGGVETPTPPTPPVLPSSLGLSAPASVETGEPVNFGSDVPASLTGVSYAWSFGDGSTSTEARPTHVYERTGSYVVGLTVRNSAGQQVSAQSSLRAVPVARLQGLRCSGAQQTGWCWQAPLPWGHLMRDLVFTDAEHGWMVGDAGALLYTRDGGTSWTEQFMPGGESLQNILFTDSRTGWLMSYRGAQLWRTEDGGSTWQARSAPPASVVGYALHTDRKGTLVVQGYFGMAISEDAAQTWRTLNLNFLGLERDGGLWVERRDIPARPEPRYYQSLDGGGYFFVDSGWAASGYAWNFKLFEQQAAIVDFDRQTAGGTVRAQLVRSSPQSAWIAPLLPVSAYRVTMIGAGGMWAPGYDTPDAITGSFLWHSQDGSSWKRVDVPAGATALGGGASPLDGASAWTQDTSKRLHVTRDGGASWQISDLPSTTAELSSLRLDGGGGLLLSDLRMNVPGWYRKPKAANAWLPLPGTTARSPVSGLAFFNRQRGLALSDDGQLLDTDDGGRNWRSRPLASLLGSSLDRVLGHDVQVKPDGRAWLLANGRIYRSRDGGLSWAAVPTRPELDGKIARQQWLDDQHARVQVRECTFVVTGSTFSQSCVRRLVSSDDGGASWVVSTMVFEDRSAMSFLNPLQAVLADANIIRRTQDGGLTWQQVYQDSSSFTAVDATWADARHVWVLLGARALRSDDGGQNWKELTLPGLDNVRPTTFLVTPQPIKLLFVDSQVGWVVGSGGQLLSTTDGGDTWAVQASGTQNDLTHITAVDRTAVWVGGNNGTILATGTGGR